MPDHDFQRIDTEEKKPAFVPQKSVSQNRYSGTRLKKYNLIKID